MPQIAHSQIHHAEPYTIHSIVTPQQALALASALEDELIEEEGSVDLKPVKDPLGPLAHGDLVVRQPVHLRATRPLLS